MQKHKARTDLANLDNLVRFNDGDGGGTGHERTKSPRGAFEHTVARFICNMSTENADIPLDSCLQKVLLPVKLLGFSLSSWVLDDNLAIGVECMLDGNISRLERSV